MIRPNRISAGILISIISAACLFAQNPIVPPGIYIADPSAHVWKDGKVYVYGSRDESPDYYCSHLHYVLSSTDLLSWSITKDAFASAGANDQVPYSDHLLYAPDCQYHQGTYFLYYCLATNSGTEGVATATSPLGPFKNGQVINTGGIDQIDPCVFIDDDGQAYYIWGQMTAKMAKLKPNMTELDLSTLHEAVVTEKEHFFHEGGYLVKRNGIYYFIYAHMGRAGKPTCIGYATATQPFGPYKYGGVIVDNDHCDPGVWNNHGSIVEFNEKWYVFYHRSTHYSVTMRKACLEAITFNEDGSINEVEMTTQGAAGPLDPMKRMDAERACLLYGNVRVVAEGPENEVLSGIRNDDKAAYKYFNFKSGIKGIDISVAPGENPGRIDIALDNSWSSSIGGIDVPGGGDGKSFVTLHAEIKGNPTGVRTVWLRFYTKDENIFKVDWFEFKP